MEPARLSNNVALRRWLEVAVLFVGLPAAYLAGVRPPFVFAGLWIGAAVAFGVLWRDSAFDRRQLVRTAALRPALPGMLGLFVVAAVLMTAAVAWWTPDRLFDFPRQRPAVWLAVVVLYPALSVYPQELIWRAYAFHRFGALLRNEHATVWLSAVLFAWVHVVMLNSLAVLLTLPGGVIFGYRYRQTRSLIATSVEHTLYGLLVFTIGIGAYFVHGMAMRR